jgi:hypothetical protein
MTDNPLADFVELPDEFRPLRYSNLLPGVIRGALEMVCVVEQGARARARAGGGGGGGGGWGGGGGVGGGGGGGGVGGGGWPSGVFG